MLFTLRCWHPLVLFNLTINFVYEKDKNLGKEMKEKKRLQNLVWDGLSNSLENQPVDNKNSTSQKKQKKVKKATGDKEKTEAVTSTE